MKRVQEAINDSADTMKHVNEAQARAEELSAKGVIGAKDLAEAYYAARSNAMGHADALVAMNAATASRSPRRSMRPMRRRSW
jgi:hypothetical protein